MFDSQSDGHDARRWRSDRVNPPSQRCGGYLGEFLDFRQFLSFLPITPRQVHFRYTTRAY